MNFGQEINNIKKFILSITTKENYEYQICDHDFKQRQEGNIVNYTCQHCKHSYWSVAIDNTNNPITDKDKMKRQFEKKLSPKLLKEFREIMK